MARLFLGLELPDTVKDTLLALSDDIVGARWQSREQLHLTLCFLGEVAPEQVPDLFSQLRGLVSPEFALTLSGVGCFGDSDRPRTLWAGLDSAPLLLTLRSELVERLRQAGLPGDFRRFHPHVTLARFGRRRAGPVTVFLERHRGMSIPPFSVRKLSLFLSQTDDRGSRYQVLARFALQADADGDGVRV